MHYYKRNLGDYYKKAGRLTIIQHGVYNLLLDACYDREKFPTRDEAIDWVWASTEEEVAAVDLCLRRFFTLNDDGTYYQQRIAEELEEYRQFCEKQARNGKRGGRPKKAPSGTEKNPLGFDRNPLETHSQPNGVENEPKKTLTTNHKLLTNKNKNPSANKFTEQDLEFAELMYDRILMIAPKAKKPNLESWANDVRLMREQDGHHQAEIRQVFEFANTDSFWAQNILSPATLRKQFPKLHAKMIGGRHANSHGSGNNRPESPSERSARIAREYLAQVSGGDLDDPEEPWPGTRGGGHPEGGGVDARVIPFERRAAGNWPA